MCFSARASFSAAALLTVLCSASLFLVYHNAKPSMKCSEKVCLATFAAVPLIFGFHQVSEGFVWLNPHNQTAIRIFAYTAYSFWPLYISLSATLVAWNRSRDLPSEPYLLFSWPRFIFSAQARRWLLVFNTILSLLLFLVLSYCVWELEPLHVITKHARLEYTTCTRWVPDSWTLTGRVIYVYAVVASLLLSTVQYSVIVSMASLVSAGVSYALWQAQFESTWCYFAALVSSSILFCVKRELEAYPDEDFPADLASVSETTADNTDECTTFGLEMNEPTPETEADVTVLENQKLLKSAVSGNVSR